MIASINCTSEILNELFGYFAMNNGSTCYTNLNSVYCYEYKVGASINRVGNN